jgi:hypothetical protein
MEKQEKLDKIINLIEELTKESCDCCGERQFYTEQIMIQALIWGSMNHYEGLGLIEATKDNWKGLHGEFEG